MIASLQRQSHSGAQLWYANWSTMRENVLHIQRRQLVTGQHLSTAVGQRHSERQELGRLDHHGHESRTAESSSVDTAVYVSFWFFVWSLYRFDRCTKNNCDALENGTLSASNRVEIVYKTGNVKPLGLYAATKWSIDAETMKTPTCKTNFIDLPADGEVK